MNLRILLTQRLVSNEKYYEIRENLDVRWGQLLSKADLLPIAFPSGFGVAEFCDPLGIGGVILTGGNDLSVFSASDLSKRRDNFEFEILRYCIARNIPVLGVCRGCQVIAAFFESELGEIEGHVGTEHKLRFADIDFLKGMDQERLFNSFHNYSIRILGESLRAIAWAESDGSIEAIKHKELPILGIMWHPERSVDSDSDIVFLRKFFVGENS